MINKVFKKINNHYLRYKQILSISLKKQQKKSDIERWSQSIALDSSWNERTQILAEHIQPNSKVLEFGSAKLVLKDMLPDGCLYFNSDIVERNEKTIVVDLNKDLPDFPKVNYIVFSGVLEYLFEVKNVLEHLSQFTDNFIFSYATIDNFDNISNRRLNGWVSDLNENDIIEMAKGLHMNFEIIGEWRKQTLYYFSK